MAKDFYHNNVRRALEQDGWVITHDPYPLKYMGLRMEIDLGAEKMIGAERGTEKILVEVKSFLSKSILHDFHEALGQFRNYLRVLRKLDADRTLLLAVPEDTWLIFFAEPFGQEAIQEENLKLVVFSPITDTIIQWIK
jgi:XisH protein